MPARCANADFTHAHIVNRLKCVAMNPDQKLMQPAYEEAIKRLYDKLVQQITEAGGDTAQIDEAEQHFTNGVALARRARDRALALLG